MMGWVYGCKAVPSENGDRGERRMDKWRPGGKKISRIEYNRAMDDENRWEQQKGTGGG